MSQYTRAVGRGLNADWTECRPPKTAICGHSADPSHTVNHHLAERHGCQSSWSTFRPFGITTPIKHRRYELLGIDTINDDADGVCQGGTLVQYDGKLRLLEIAQVPKDRVSDFMLFAGDFVEAFLYSACLCGRRECMIVY